MRRPGRGRGLPRRPPVPAEPSTCASAWHAVADQGRTASCVGWAVADSRAALAARRRPAGWRPTSPCPPATCGWPSKEFDQRDRRTRRRSSRRTATSLKAGLDVVRKFGVPLERELPVERQPGRRLARGLQRARPRARKLMALLQPRRRHGGPPRLLDGWRRWLHQRGPCRCCWRMDRHLAHRAAMLTGFDADSVDKQPRRGAVRLRPGPLPAALQLGHRLGRRRLRADGPRLRRGGRDRELRRRWSEPRRSGLRRHARAARARARASARG